MLTVRFGFDGGYIGKSYKLFWRFDFFIGYYEGADILGIFLSNVSLTGEVSIEGDSQMYGFFFPVL